MLRKEVGANSQNILVAFSHVDDIMVDEKVILVVREPDVEEPYSRIQLLGNVHVLRLSNSYGSLNAARIMGSRNTQRRHQHIIRDVTHPRTVRYNLIRRVFPTGSIRAMSVHLVGELAGNLR